MINIVPRIAAFMKGKEELETDALEAEMSEVRHSTKVKINNQFDTVLALMEQTLIEMTQTRSTPAKEDEQDR